MADEKLKIKKCRVEELEKGDVVVIDREDSVYKKFGVVEIVGETILHSHLYVKVLAFNLFGEKENFTFYQAETEYLEKIVMEKVKNGNKK